ncbi:MAG: hypothetical protein ACLVJO_11795 [[Clostridium] scindens]
MSNVVRRFHDVRVMLYDKYCISQIPKFLKNCHQPGRIFECSPALFHQNIDDAGKFAVRAAASQSRRVLRLTK